MKRLSASAGVSRFCVSALTEVPLAEEAVLDAAADRDVALRLQLLAGGRGTASHVFGGQFGVEPAPCEVALVVGDAEADGVEADAVLLALVDGQLRRSGRARARTPADRPLSGVDVTEPDVLHVVDAVEQELDVGRRAGGRRVRELRDDVARCPSGSRATVDAVSLLELLRACRRSMRWMPTASCSPHHHIFNSPPRPPSPDDAVGSESSPPHAARNGPSVANPAPAAEMRSSSRRLNGRVRSSTAAPPCESGGSPASSAGRLETILDSFPTSIGLEVEPRTGRPAATPPGRCHYSTDVTRSSPARPTGSAGRSPIGSGPRALRVSGVDVEDGAEVRFDLADADGIAGLVDRIEADRGPVDVLCSVAGVFEPVPALSDEHAVSIAASCPSTSTRRWR